MGREGLGGGVRGGEAARPRVRRAASRRGLAAHETKHKTRTHNIKPDPVYLVYSEYSTVNVIFIFVNLFHSHCETYRCALGHI